MKPFDVLLTTPDTDKEDDLRDIFAGFALMGEASCQAPGNWLSPHTYDKAADKCYAMANAMLDKRREILEKNARKAASTHAKSGGD